MHYCMFLVGRPRGGVWIPSINIDITCIWGGRGRASSWAPGASGSSSADSMPGGALFWGLICHLMSNDRLLSIYCSDLERTSGWGSVNWWGSRCAHRRGRREEQPLEEALVVPAADLGLSLPQWRYTDRRLLGHSRLHTGQDHTAVQDRTAEWYHTAGWDRKPEHSSLRIGMHHMVVEHLQQHHCLRHHHTSELSCGRLAWDIYAQHSSESYYSVECEWRANGGWRAWKTQEDPTIVVEGQWYLISHCSTFSAHISRISEASLTSKNSSFTITKSHAGPWHCWCCHVAKLLCNPTQHNAANAIPRDRTVISLPL